MMHFTSIQQSFGLNLEKIQNLKTPSGKILNYIRMSKSFWTMIKNNCDFIRFISLQPDHDVAYS